MLTYERKIIHTNAVFDPTERRYLVIALCDDGTLWQGDHEHGDWSWTKIPNVPQPGDKRSCRDLVEARIAAAPTRSKPKTPVLAYCRAASADDEVCLNSLGDEATPSDRQGG
jgi:hypothetical protein